MRLVPRLPEAPRRAYGATDFTYHYRLVAMSPGRSGALRMWKGLDREPFRHRPGMFVTPTAASRQSMKASSESGYRSIKRTGFHIGAHLSSSYITTVSPRPSQRWSGPSFDRDTCAVCCRPIRGAKITGRLDEKRKTWLQQYLEAGFDPMLGLWNRRGYSRGLYRVYFLSA